MKLKDLKKGDAFHFADDNAEKEFVVALVSDTVIKVDEISLISSSSMSIKREWDYLGARDVIKLYKK